MQGPDGELLVTLWGWSQDSVAEAAAMARDRLSRMAHLGGRLPPNEYYPRTPLREEVLHELTSTDGTLLAVVTRNRYGAQVLNTDAVVFVDVDVAEQRRGFWARLRREPAPTSAADAAVARISAFATNHPEWGVHAYRTAAGFRVLVTGSGAGPQLSLIHI